MATKLTKKQQTQLTEKLTGIIQKNNALQLRMSTDTSVNELNINQISGELNRIHYRAIGKELPPAVPFMFTQLGSGIPAPDNIRPIIGYEIDGIGTVYGGELNIDTGILSLTYDGVDLGTLTWRNYKPGGFRSIDAIGAATTTEQSRATCEKYNMRPSNTTLTSGEFLISGSFIYIVDSAFTDNATVFKESLSGVYLVYKLVTSETYTLTPQQMIQLLDQL